MSETVGDAGGVSRCTSSSSGLLSALFLFPRALVSFLGRFVLFCLRSSLLLCLNPVDAVLLFSLADPLGHRVSKVLRKIKPTMSADRYISIVTSVYSTEPMDQAQFCHIVEERINADKEY